MMKLSLLVVLGILLASLGIWLGSFLLFAGNRAETNVTRDSSHQSKPSNSTVSGNQAPSVALSTAGDTSKTHAVDELRQLLHCHEAQLIFDGANRTLDESRKPGVAPQVSLTKLTRAQQRLAAVQKDLDQCKSIPFSRESTDDVYPALLLAAKLGDSEAAACYVAAPFEISDTEQGRQISKEFDSNARELIQQGIENGDWRSLSLLEALSNEMRPTKGLFARLNKPDGLARYRLMLVRRLGTEGEYANTLDQQISVQKERLQRQGVGSVEIAAASQWAQDMFDRNFASSAKLVGNPAPCADPFMKVR